jgi:hypothetical protein
VLEPLGLAWRAVDRRTIQITTLAKAQSEFQLEVYRIAADAKIDGEQLAARVNALAAAAGGESLEGGAVAYDAESRVLLIRQPAAVHRRLVAELSDVLAPAASTKPS